MYCTMTSLRCYMNCTSPVYQWRSGEFQTGERQEVLLPFSLPSLSISLPAFAVLPLHTSLRSRHS